MKTSKLCSAASIDEATFHAPAVQDLADLADDSHARSPKAAQHVRAAILQSLMWRITLRSNPPYETGLRV